MKTLAVSSLAVATITFSAITFYSSPFYFSQSCAGSVCSEAEFTGEGVSASASIATKQTLADLSSDNQSVMLMPLGVSGSVM